MLVAVQHDRDWRRFCEEVLQNDALAADPRFVSNQLRVQHRDALTTAIQDVFSRLSTTDVIRRLDAADLASARVNSVQDFIDHPQLAARDRWRQIDSPAGPIRTLLPPLCIEGTAPALGPVPALGEQTDAVLEELSFDRATIDAWKRTGVL